MAKKKKNISENKDLVPVERMNRRLWITVFGIAAFLVFMYLSKVFIPSRASMYDLGPIEMNGETYLVASWKWDKSTNTMEIIYAIEGKYSMPEDVSSRMGVRTNSGETRHDGKVIYQTDKTIVIAYSGISDSGTEFEVRLTVDNNEPHFFNNKNMIEIVDEIPQKTEQEYLKISRETVLNYYQAQIEAVMLKIAENEDTITNKKAEIQSYKENTSYKTQAQLKEIDSSIQRLEGEIAEIENTNLLLQNEIAEFQERIENLRKEIDAI